MIDNNNARILDYDPVKWSNPMKHGQHFKLKKKITPNRVKGEYGKKMIYYIIHHIQTQISISELKHTHSAFQMLKDNHSFLTEHYWSPTEFDTIQLGFFQGYNPQHYDRVTAAQREANFLVSKDIKANKIPRFQLIQTTHRAQWDCHHAGTTAYSLELMTEDATQMASVITEGFRDHPENFVAYKMRGSHPERFYMVVRKQNFTLQIQHIIVINNIGLAAMFYLDERIRAIPGVIDVVESRKCDTTGRVNIIVQKEQFISIREYMTEKFNGWYTKYADKSAKSKEGQIQRHSSDQAAGRRKLWKWQKIVDDNKCYQLQNV